MTDLNIEILAAGEICRYFKPSTRREAVLLERLNETVSRLTDLEYILDNAGLDIEPSRLEKELDDLDKLVGPFQHLFDLIKS